MIKIGIVGYGNLGKSCEKIINNSKDLKLVAIFSRRKIKSQSGAIVENLSDIKNYIGKIDVMLLCSGSATDIPKQGREIIKYFNTADSYDTHALLHDYYHDMDSLAKENGHTAVIACGWDPGLFSYMRLLFETILPKGETYTFWGKGVSQGHSEAIRKIDGVKYGIQYTIPKDNAINLIREGKTPELSARDKHLRMCYVVAEDNADKEKIKKTIINIPNYFADYDTEVNFISEAQFLSEHNKMPHGGLVIRSGKSNDTKHNMEFSIKLESNPDFTASVLVNYGRACARLAKSGVKGAKTIYEIPLIYANPESHDKFLKRLL